MTKDDETRCVTASELAGSLSALLDDVEAGETITITRRGIPIAVLSPVPNKARARAEETLVASEEPASYLAVATSRALRPPATALSRLIATPSTREVMSVFLMEPAAVLHQREIARRAHVGLRSAQIALARLEELGLLASKRNGNRLYYRALRTERFEGVRALVSRELGFTEVIARHLGELRKPVTWAFVFGSAATGADRLGSDIDLLVVSDASDDALVEPIAEAQRELGREIDLVSYRPAEFERKRIEGNHFLMAVLAQPRIDLIGGGDGS